MNLSKEVFVSERSRGKGRVSEVRVCEEEKREEGVGEKCNITFRFMFKVFCKLAFNVKK